MDQYANIPIDINHKLRIAAASGDIESVISAISNGAIIDSFAESGRTALHRAVTANRYNVVKVLMEMRANVNMQDAYGNTPLHLGIDNDSYESVMLLFESPALDLRLRDSLDRTPLHIACQNGDYPMINFLISKDKINVPRGSNNILLCAILIGKKPNL
jgi:ankyrin repeat protein